MSSAKSSIESAGLVGTAEKSFLQPKASHVTEAYIPTLDEFDTEIDIYRVSTIKGHTILRKSFSHFPEEKGN